MVNFLRDRVSARKARLFACACFRYPKVGLGDWELRILEIGEQASDGLPTENDIQAANDVSVGSGDSGVAWAILTDDWWSAVEAARAAGEWEKEAVQCDLVRDIFGNPFRPAVFSPDWRTNTAVSLAQQMYDSRDF